MAIRKSGYVALFDVLGFSERVMRGALHGLDKYVQTVLHNTQDHENLGTILFSDTVVLYTFDDSEASFDAIISASSALFHDLLLAEVPVRGAISFGDFTRSEHQDHGTVIAGRPIIEAHNYESRSQWIGIMLAPSVLEQRPEISEASCAMSTLAAQPPEPGRPIAATVKLMFQHCAEIPLEDAAGHIATLDGFAIVPLNHAETLAALRDRLDEARGALRRLKQLAPDPRSQAKYQRSLNWLNAIRTDFVRAFDNRIEASRAR